MAVNMKIITIAVLSVALIVSLTACGDNSPTVGQPSSNPQQNTLSQSSNDANNEMGKITFPAYTIQNAENILVDNSSIVDMINNTPVFNLSFPLQENWELKTEKGDETLPTGQFYTPVYIYEFDKLIGYIGFSPYVLDNPDNAPIEDAEMNIFLALRMSSQFQWGNDTAVKSTDNGKAAVMDIDYMAPNGIPGHPGAMPDVDQYATTGIVIYDIELNVAVGIAFMPDTISKELAAEIAEKVEIIPVEHG